MRTLFTSKMRQTNPEPTLLVATSLLMFSGAVRADFDDSAVTVILVFLLGWPAIVAVSAFIAGKTKAVLLMVCASVLYPLSAYLTLAMAHGLLPSRATEGQSGMFAILLLSVFWAVALLWLRRWKKQVFATAESGATKR